MGIPHSFFTFFSFFFIFLKSSARMSLKLGGLLLISICTVPTAAEGCSVSLFAPESWMFLPACVMGGGDVEPPPTAPTMSCAAGYCYWIQTSGQCSDVAGGETLSDQAE